jgi:hypothetical protein
VLLPNAPVGVRDSANGDIDGLVSSIAALQVSYFSTNGKYWQGLATHSAIPADAAEVAPDMLGDAPSDQVETWEDFGVSLPGTTCVCLHVDTYNGSSGHGYVVRGQVVLDGTTYNRSVNVGPDYSHSTDGWEIVETW